MPSDPPSTPRISKALTRRVYRYSKRWLPAAGGTYHFSIFTRQFESPCLIPPTQKSGSSCLVLHGCSEADPSHFNCPANGRFIRYAAVPRLTHLQQFSCCVRAQRKFRIHRMGSQPPFAAAWMNGGCRWERRKRSFLPPCPTPRQIKHVDRSKTPGEIPKVLAGLCRDNLGGAKVCGKSYLPPATSRMLPVQ